MGGVTTGRDALELVAAGASAVALGTVLFTDPDAPARIRAELDTELELLRLDSLEAAEGLAHAGGIAPRTRTVAGSSPM